MVDISRKTYERNGVETTVDNYELLWLNEKHKEEGLDHEKLWVTTVNNLLDHKKHRYELLNEPVKQPHRLFVDKELTIKVFMDCRITAPHKFQTRIGFKQ